MRREFTKPTKRDALKRANNECEGVLANGKRCCAPLTIGKVAFDHVIADALGGEPTLANCAVLCLICHAEKTDKRDKPAIARAVRLSDAHAGIRNAPSHKLRGPGFVKSAKPKRIELAELPRRDIHTRKVIA